MQLATADDGCPGRQTRHCFEVVVRDPGVFVSVVNGTDLFTMVIASLHLSPTSQSTVFGFTFSSIVFL